MRIVRCGAVRCFVTHAVTAPRAVRAVRAVCAVQFFVTPVCVCVRLSQADILYRPGCTDRAGFWHTEASFDLSYPVFQETIGNLQKIRVLPLIRFPGVTKNRTAHTARTARGALTGCVTKYRTARTARTARNETPHRPHRTAPRAPHCTL